MYSWYMVEVREGAVWIYVGEIGLGSMYKSVAEEFARGIAARRGSENVRVVEFVRKAEPKGDDDGRPL